MTLENLDRAFGETVEGREKIRIGRRSYVNFAKSMIFMPMAISFVGASVIWNFMYEVNACSFSST